MTDLKEYEVEIGGLSHTLMLSDEGAKARGLSAPVAKSDTSKHNKSRKPSNKSA